jgi:hypothetical protein
MEQEHYLTEFDGLVQTRELQMLKAMLHFASPRSQMPLAMLIQTMEFQNTMRMFQNNNNVLTAFSVHNEADRRSAMLQTLKKLCTPRERETIDTVLNIMCVMESKEDIYGRISTE